MSRPQPTSDDDTDLVLRVGEGDARAYHELCSRHAARLRAFVMRLVRNDADADDIVQETFLRLWLRAGEYERRARFVTWLCQIAHNLAVDRLRASNRWQPLPDDDAMPISARQPSLVDEKHRAEALERAIAGLPERQAAAIELVHRQGLTGTEASEVLGIGAEALESLLSRARRTLKAELSAWSNRDGEKSS
ncbi:MAG TPA: sigma-70 family RNA polymerase sigma factor [Polyangiaceae bacterium]|nr:sigma-70 family RNA polymerase sigma factor [Polyangiaceae bacterium]